LAAPAAFLLAVTVAVLLVRAGLGDSGADTSAATSTRTPVTSTARTTTKTTTKPRPKRFYVVESGDTYGTIATKFGTSVDVLITLNPEVDPNALRVGQRVRVR
jgi:LysM repeat protein